MAHWFQRMSQQVGSSSVLSFLSFCCSIFVVVYLYYLFVVVFSFSLDGEDSDLSRGASRMSSPIQSEDEMISEDLETASDLSKFSYLLFSFVFLFCILVLTLCSLYS